MENSILISTKKALNVLADDDAFDGEIIMHINSVLSTLNQIGIGPNEGVFIEDDSVEWDALIGDDPRLNSVKTYVYLRVRLLFDPPATSFAIASMDRQIKELEYRINVQREHTAWVDPDPGLPDETVLDGGHA